MIVVDFLAFAMAHRRCGSVKLPQPKRQTSPGCPLSRLSETVQRLLHDESLAMSDRVAGLIVVLFAQPVTRVTVLRLADVHEHDGAVALALGDEPVVLPERAAALLSAYLRERGSEKTTNASPFLFPGRRAGYPMIA